MKDFYQIIILTKSDFNQYSDCYAVIKDVIFLVDHNTIKFHNQIINFEYLVFDDPKLISNFLNCNILHDNQIPVTNFFCATSIENIFYTKDLTKAIANIENEELF